MRPRSAHTSRDVAGMIAAGMSPDEVAMELPPLDRDDVAAALGFAAGALSDPWTSF